MYDDLVKLARHCSEEDACITCPVGGCQGPTKIMNRLADVIEELRKKVDEWQEEACKWNNEYYYLLDNTPRWIPVTDHTPKYNGYYIVCDNDNDVFTAYFGNTTKNWWTGRTVTHWMPRPEPPKEEKIE